MPNRYLRESYVDSQRVNSLSWVGEVFWTRLLVKVDDFGRLEANPTLLRAKLFPLKLEHVREAEVSRLLAECEKAGLLRLYTLDGKDYLQMERWEKGRALKSKCPNPPPPKAKSPNICKHMFADANISPDPGTDNDPDSGSGTDARECAPAATALRQSIVPGMPDLAAWLERIGVTDEWELEWWTKRWEATERVGWVTRAGQAIANWEAHQDSATHYFRSAVRERAEKARAREGPPAAELEAKANARATQAANESAALLAALTGEVRR